jgi:hypothetical protein
VPKNIMKHVAQVTNNYKIFSFICIILLLACCDSTNATLNKGGVTLGNMSIVPITPKQQSSLFSSLLKQACGSHNIYVVMRILLFKVEFSFLIFFSILHYWSSSSCKFYVGCPCFSLWTMHDEYSAIITKVQQDAIFLKFIHNFLHDFLKIYCNMDN